MASRACSARSRPTPAPPRRWRCWPPRRPRAWPSWPPTTATSRPIAAAVARESERLGAEAWYATLPDDRPRVDRLPVARVRRQRRAAAVLRRPRRAGRRPPEGGLRPGRADRRGRPLLPQRLLPPAPDGVGRAARDVRRARPRRAADATRGRRRRRARRHQRAAARRAAARRRLAGRRRPRAAVPARHRRPENAPAERAVTDRLYGGDREHRLRQEILLGIGGAEGARRRRRRSRGVPLQRGPCRLPRHRAPAAARRGAGPRSAGRDRVGARRDGVHHPHAGAGRHRPVLARPGRRYFGPGGVPSGLPIDLLLDLGSEPGGDPARLQHGRARHPPLGAHQRRLAPARPGRPRHVRRALPRLPGRRGADRAHHVRRPRRDLDRPEFAALYRSASATASASRCTAMRRWPRAPTTSSALPRRRPRAAGGRCAAAAAHDVDGARHPRRPARVRRWSLDPERSRSASRAACRYKRPTLFLRDPERLERLLLDAERPVQIVFAGKAHPRLGEARS